MYKCKECEIIFNIPKKIPAEIFYGVDNEFNFRSGELISVCPYCEGTFTTIKKEQIKIKLYNKNNKSIFYKYFDTEFDRDKFLRKLKYSKKIILINDYKSNFD